jgi:hypothetical protein
MLAQKDITKFMGIPVDGFKKDMIQKLKAKGFEYDNEIDLLTGEFNGEKVNIFVATQSNKVWRIVVFKPFSFKFLNHIFFKSIYGDSHKFCYIFLC